jgi:hypothetical protein
MNMTSFLTLILVGGEWLAACPGPLLLGKEPTVPIGRLGGPQSQPGQYEVKILDLAGTRTPTQQSS